MSPPLTGFTVYDALTLLTAYLCLRLFSSVFNLVFNSVNLVAVIFLSGILSSPFYTNTDGIVILIYA
jgi:hypothetical protein